MTNRAKAENATAYQITGRLSLAEWLLGWFRNIGQFFVDFNPSSQASWLYRAPLALGTFALSFLVLYSFYYLCVKAPKSNWLLFLSLIGTPALALTVHDLLLEGFLSIIIKYLTPCCIGFQLAVAYIITQRLHLSKLEYSGRSCGRLFQSW